MIYWFVVFAIGVAAFVASLVKEKPAVAGGAPEKSTQIDALRLGGVVFATLGLVAMSILSAASGGLFAGSGG